MTATLNDDPETLEAILRWGDSQDMNPGQGSSLARSQELEENPILLSSLEGYTACMEHLYRAGYRIRLLDSDWRRVRSELDHTDRNQAFLTSLEKAWEKLIQYKEVCCQSEDPVSRYLLFKAYANPQYLSIQLLARSPKDTSLATVDPLRLAFALGHHAQLLATYFPEHTVEYSKIGESCEKFTREILAYCSNTRDVVTLLEHSPEEQEQEEQENKETNWHLALKGGHKSFVSHPYFQHFTWNKIRGTSYDPFTFYLLKRIRAFPLAILLFFVYPFILVMDSIFREGKILFESPDTFRKRKSKEANAKETKESHLESQEESRPENGFWAFFRERLHRPIYRMSVSVFWEIFFLSMLYLSFHKPRLDETGSAPFGITDFIMWFFIFNYFLFGLEDFFRQKTDFLSSFWCCYTLFTNVVLISGAGIAFWGGNTNSDNEGMKFDRARVDGNHALNIGLTLVAYGAVMQCLRTIRWFLLHRSIGPVVVCFIQVLKDVIYVFAIFFVIYLSFALGIWYMYKPFTYRGENNDEDLCETKYCIKQQTIKGNKGMRGIFSKMFWEVFDGTAEDTTIHEIGEFNKDDSTRMSMEFSHVMAVSMWAMYQGITAILLINILIALMNSTYMRVWENVDTEWKYSKTYQVCTRSLTSLISNFLPPGPVPAPAGHYAAALQVDLLPGDPDQEGQDGTVWIRDCSNCTRG